MDPFKTLIVGTPPSRTYTASAVGLLTAANNLSDVADASSAFDNLSGMSTESLSARLNSKAPRGGVAFDGTSAARAYSTLTNQSIGTDVFSVTVVFYVPTSNPAATAGIFAISSVSTGTGGSAFDAAIDTSGVLQVNLRGSAVTDYRLLSVSGFRAAYSGKVVVLTVTRPSSGDAVIYVNGVAQSASETTGGTPPANWQGSITSTYFVFGTNYGGQEAKFAIYSASLYNLALSAADVLEIAESGGAVPFRYQYGSQTELITTAANRDFSSDTGAWGKGTGVTISGGKLNFSSGSYANYNFSASRGRAYRATFDIDATSTSVVVDDGSTTVYVSGLTAGASQKLEFVAGHVYLEFIVASSGTATIDNVGIVRIGAICHYALDDGIGYQLHDASTNKLDAVMTTTGVSHLVPKASGYVRDVLTWSADYTGKTVGGGRSLPAGAVVRDIHYKLSAGTTGTGILMETSTTAAHWMARISRPSAGKYIATLANRLPSTAGAAAGDFYVNVVPDSVNYTGSVSVEVFYDVGTAQ